MDARDFNKARSSLVIDLPCGLRVELCRPNVLRAIISGELSPEYIKLVTARSAGLVPDEDMDQAYRREAHALTISLICEASICPKITLRETSDENSIWWRRFSGEELQLLGDKVRELVGLSEKELESLAPFPDAPDAGAAEQALELPAE